MQIILLQLIYKCRYKTCTMKVCIERVSFWFWWIFSAQECNFSMLSIPTNGIMHTKLFSQNIHRIYWRTQSRIFASRLYLLYISRYTSITALTLRLASPILWSYKAWPLNTSFDILNSLFIFGHHIN